jgi:PAS domain S-box-containing protein
MAQLGPSEERSQPGTPAGARGLAHPTSRRDLPGENIDRLVRLVARSLRAPLAVFHLPHAGRRFHKTWIGLPEPAASRLETLVSDAFLQHLHASSETLVVRNARRDTIDPAAALAELGIAACACVPLLSQGAKLGSLCVMDAAPRDWTDDELEILADLAAVAVSEIELQQDFAEQQRREDALRESEARLRVAVRATGAAVWVIDLARGGVEYFDRRGCEVLQIDLEQREWPPGTLCAHLHPEDVGVMQSAFGAAMSARSEPVEYRVIRRDGEVRWLQGAGEPQCDAQGRPLRFVGVSFDITERKRAEQALRASDERLRLALGASHAGAWQWDIASNALAWSRENHALYGFDPADGEPTPERWERAVHPDDLERTRAALCSVLEGRDEELRIEYRVLHPVCGTRWLLGIGRVQRDANGRPVSFSGINVDVTERRSIEKALREKEAFQNAILTSAGVCVIAVDTGGKIISFNRTAQQLLGYTAEEVIGRLSPLALHRPEELAARAAELSRELGRPVEPRHVFTATLGRTGRDAREWTFVRKDGSTVPVELTVTSLEDASGALIGFLGVAHDLTASKAVENALRESEQHLRIVTDSTEAWLARIDTDERYLFANRAFTQRAGMRRRTVIGRTVHEVVGEAAYAVLKPELARALAGERVLFEGFVPYYAMGERYVRIEYIPERDARGAVHGVVGVIVDLTERRRAEDALRESEARLATLTAAVPALLFSTTADGRVDYVNDTFFEYSGLSRETPLAPAWQRIVHREDLARVLSSWDESVRTGEDLNVECRLRRADGVYRWFKGYAAQLRDERRRATKWLGVALDIDDQKKAEAALQDANRRKNEFLAMLAHELRNPLAPIRNSAHILQMLSVGEPRLKTTTEMIGRQVNHMARLIDDLLDVARITQGKITLRREPAELMPLLYNAVESVRPFIDARGHELRIDAPREPICLEADATRLTQVLSNLLSNAAKYTDAGGQIALSAKREGEQLVIVVRDNGIGIAADLLPHLFDPFTQSDRSLDRSQGGLGIGLSLVKRLVEMHGGSVEARSAGHGRGSTFTVRLPALDCGPMPQRLPRPEVQRAGPSPVRLRVLVVDDNVDAEQSVSLLMRLHGHEVRAAHDGMEALRQARAFRPQVVLLDIGLPGMNGYDVARKLRAVPETADATLIAVTGYGQAEDRDQAMEAGFQHHMVKPVEPQALIQLIQGLAKGESLEAGG